MVFSHIKNHNPGNFTKRPFIPDLSKKEKITAAATLLLVLCIGGTAAAYIYNKNKSSSSKTLSTLSSNNNTDEESPKKNDSASSTKKTGEKGSPDRKTGPEPSVKNSSNSDTESENQTLNKNVASSPSRDCNTVYKELSDIWQVFCDTKTKENKLLFIAKYAEAANACKDQDRVPTILEYSVQELVKRVIPNDE